MTKPISQKGMTLVELMVSLTVILLVMAAASGAYLKLFRGYKTQGKIAESYIDNLSGLEMLRYDFEMAGYGVPYSLNGNVYSEAVAAVTPAALNDTANPAPRAVAFSNNTGSNNSDVVAIKSSVASATGVGVGKKWSFIMNDGVNPAFVKAWGSAALNPDLDFTTGDWFIILDGDGRALQSVPPAATSPPAWAYRYSGTFGAGYYANATAIPCPPNNQSVYLIYGIRDSALRMPFNRVDYHLSRPANGFPSRCDPNSFILYRSPINHGDGQRNEQPLLECVMDFQLGFGLDTDADGNVDTWQADIGALTAAQIRARLREVRVFILLHEGQLDRDFRFSGTLNLGDQDITDSLAPGNTFQTLSGAAVGGALSSFTPAGNDLRYRWKVIKLAIKPMNLE
jgi:prepilin-type N-terminal cleavage/methylation domain-containing protein